MSRLSIWLWATSKYNPAYVLPSWTIALRAILFPLDTLYWVLSKYMGYNMYEDVWYIHGSRFSGRALANLANANGEIYRIYKLNDTIYLEKQ